MMLLSVRLTFYRLDGEQDAVDRGFESPDTSTFVRRWATTWFSTFTFPSSWGDCRPADRVMATRLLKLPKAGAASKKITGARPTSSASPPPVFGLEIVTLRTEVLIPSIPSIGSLFRFGVEFIQYGLRCDILLNLLDVHRVPDTHVQPGRDREHHGGQFC